MLDNAPILIVEDEPLIALELQASIEEAGGKVVGPAGSVSEALMLLDTFIVAAAILDIQLSDGEVTPVAKALVARKVPLIFQSGINPPNELQRLCPEGVIYEKPVPTRLLIEKLAELIKR